jgi:hypothetical protein
LIIAAGGPSGSPTFAFSIVTIAVDSSGLVQASLGVGVKLADPYTTLACAQVAYIRSHIASFRGDAKFGRYRGIADIGQAAPIKFDL